MLLQVHEQVRPVAQLQHRAERVVVYLHRVEQLHDLKGSVRACQYARVLEFLVDRLLTKGVLNVIGLQALAPVVVKLVDLASNLTAAVQVKRLV